MKARRQHGFHLITRLNISEQKLKTIKFGVRGQSKGATKPQMQELKEDYVTRRT